MSTESGPQPQPTPEERTRRLVERGEALDEGEARNILWEEDEATHVRSLDRREAIAAIDRDLADPETDEFDQYELRYRKAIFETAETPDEIELLLYVYLTDIEATDRGMERLDRKAAEVARRIGEERARGLETTYRTRMQQLMSEY